MARLRAAEREVLMKTIITTLLSVILTTGTPLANVHVDTGKCINNYKENGTSYSAVQTSTGDMWIAKGKVVKRKKLVVVFDDKGTESIYDDEVIYITSLGR